MFRTCPLYNLPGQAPQAGGASPPGNRMNARGQGQREGPHKEKRRPDPPVSCVPSCFFAGQPFQHIQCDMLEYYSRILLDCLL